ncbi:MAG: hypothetical protein ACRDM0_08920 [Thermoleophilaceae bacterium]
MHDGDGELLRGGGELAKLLVTRGARRRRSERVAAIEQRDAHPGATQPLGVGPASGIAADDGRGSDAVRRAHRAER